MDIFIKAILAVFLIICFITEVKKNKIYNWVVVLFIIVGLSLNFVYGGVYKGLGSLIGGIIPLILFAPFFILKMFRARDIKIFSVIGFLMGGTFSLNNIIYSFIVGAIILTVVMMVKKNLLKGIKRSVIFSQGMLDYEKGKGKFPLATAIFFGTILQLVINYKFIYFK